MGFFEDVVKTIGNPVQAIGNALGSKDIANAGKTIGSFDPGKIYTNPNNPNIWGKGNGSLVSVFDPPAGAPTGVGPADPTAAANATLTQQKQQQAQDFRAGIPQLEKGLTRQYALQSHNQLAQQLSGIRRDAAQRGIMNSGIRLGNEGNAQAGAASKLAEMRSQLHNGALGQADQLDQDAINAGITQTQIAQQLQDNIYNQALKNMAERNSTFASLGSSAGGVVGTAAGSQTDASKLKQKQSLYGG